MGISIAITGSSSVASVTLECDDASQMFCRGFAEFTHTEGFVGCHRDAMNAGWLERNTTEGRFWLCPECSGK